MDKCYSTASKAKEFAAQHTFEGKGGLFEGSAARGLGVMPMPGLNAFSRTTPNKKKTRYHFLQEFCLYSGS